MDPQSYGSSAGNCRLKRSVQRNTFRRVLRALMCYGSAVTSCAGV